MKKEDKTDVVKTTKEKKDSNVKVVDEKKDVEKDDIIVKDTANSENTKGNSVASKIWKVIRLILLIITSPIWFPWKILFVRRPGHKYHEVSPKVRAFRLLRSPITKPLKFILYIAIIGLEVLLVYKARYSTLALPFTKSSVHNYYMNNQVLSEDKQDDLKKVFNTIDSWDKTSKNNMYVIFDSEIVKMGFEHTDEASKAEIIDKFNNDENFREDLHEIAKNIDKTVSRGIKEFSSLADDETVEAVLKPITTVGSVVDYRQVLDATAVAVKTSGQDLGTFSIDSEELVESVSLFAEFSRGKSLKEVTGYQDTTQTSEFSVTIEPRD